MPHAKRSMFTQPWYSASDVKPRGEGEYLATTSHGVRLVYWLSQDSGKGYFVDCVERKLKEGDEFQGRIFAVSHWMKKPKGAGEDIAFTELGIQSFIGYLDFETVELVEKACKDIIDKANAEPKRTVWLVTAGGVNLAYFREDQYAQAAQAMIKAYEEQLLENADDFLKGFLSEHEFDRENVKLVPRRVTQREYFETWFPEERIDQ